MNSKNAPTQKTLSATTNNNTLGSSFSNAILTWMELSSIHSLINIAKATHVLQRAIWIVCLFVSSFICVWFIMRSIHDYLDYAVVSQIGITFVTYFQYA